MTEEPEDSRLEWRWCLRIGAIGLTLAIILVAGCPVYGVWQQGLVGEAELKRAEQNRKVAIQEAMAKEESAKHLAQAEVSRAEGVAKANTIIGESLKGNEVYLHYLWINNLGEIGKDHQVIYVPTEANLPLLEASRLKVERRK
jgi:predicted aminopeptidase